MSHELNHYIDFLAQIIISYANGKKIDVGGQLEQDGNDPIELQEAVDSDYQIHKVLCPYKINALLTKRAEETVSDHFSRVYAYLNDTIVHLDRESKGDSRWGAERQPHLKYILQTYKAAKEKSFIIEKFNEQDWLELKSILTEAYKVLYGLINNNSQTVNLVVKPLEPAMSNEGFIEEALTQETTLSHCGKSGGIRQGHLGSAIEGQFKFLKSMTLERFDANFDEAQKQYEAKSHKKITLQNSLDIVSLKRQVNFHSSLLSSNRAVASNEQVNAFARAEEEVQSYEALLALVAELQQQVQSSQTAAASREQQFNQQLQRLTECLEQEQQSKQKQEQLINQLSTRLNTLEEDLLAFKSVNSSKASPSSTDIDELPTEGSGELSGLRLGMQSGFNLFGFLSALPQHSDSTLVSQNSSQKLNETGVANSSLR